MSETTMLHAQPFFFLRHGETDWNRERRVQGQTDIPLNEKGIAQAHSAKSLLVGCGVDVVCCSPLRRAHDTALIVNEALKCQVVIMGDLREVGLGSREGQRKGNWYSQWKRGVTPPGAESHRNFIERALRGINAALARNGRVLIVAHGGVYSAVEQYGELVRHGEIPNCTPVRHDPPTRDVPRWAAQVVSRPQ